MNLKQKKKKKFESLYQLIIRGASVRTKNTLSVFLGAQNNHVKETCEHFEIGVKLSATTANGVRWQDLKKVKSWCLVMRMCHVDESILGAEPGGN